MYLLKVQVSAVEPDALDHVADMLRDLASARRGDAIAGAAPKPWSISVEVEEDRPRLEFVPADERPHHLGGCYEVR